MFADVWFLMLKGNMNGKHRKSNTHVTCSKCHNSNLESSKQALLYFKENSPQLKSLQIKRVGTK